MLPLVLQEIEFWDEVKEEFVHCPEVHLKFEHSLISLKKWEQKFKKPFLNTQLNGEELFYYIKCMSIDPNIKDEDVYRLMRDKALITKVLEYMKDPMTATTFNKENIKKMKNTTVNSEVTTAETIYYWMTALNIPFSCEKWHLNSLLALVEFCNLKQTPPKKMSQTEALQHQAALNKARRPKKPSKK